MDLNQLTYIITIAEEKSITKAAEKLYITQSGLNQKLLKLEKELGLPLFFRTKNELLLTQAGKVYIDYARRILSLKKEAYNIIRDLANCKTGQITVGFTAERGALMFANIYKMFFQRFSGITLQPEELSVKHQKELISSEHLDLGFITISPNYPVCNEKIHLSWEDMLFAAPASDSLFKDLDPEIPVSPALFKDKNFVIMFNESSQRPLIDELIKLGGVKHILFETSSNHTLLNMVKSGFACTFLPALYACNDPSIRFFKIATNPQLELACIYKKDRYLNNAEKYLIEIAGQFWKSYPYITKGCSFGDAQSFDN